MNLIKYFIQRRITTLCLNVGIALLGLFCLNKTSVDLFPPIHLPTLTITIPAMGLSSRDIENKITNPLEEKLNILPHLKNLRSESRTNYAIFILKFEWGYSIDFAALSVRESLKNVSLPKEADSPIIFRWNPSEDPILRADLSAKEELPVLTRLIERSVRPRLERIPGIATVHLSGTLHSEVKVKVDPDVLSARGLTMDRLVNLLSQENSKMQVGTYSEGRYELSLVIPSEFKSIEDIKNLPIYFDPRKPFRLKDIAEIIEENEKVKTIARISGNPSIGLSFKKTHSAATLDVIEAIKKEFKHILDENPTLSLHYSKDDSIYINMSRSTVIGNIWQGILFTFIFVLLFLQSLGPTLIISAAIPIAITGTFAFMKYFNVSQNVFSLAGFALASGMIVDCGVVILENIYRQYHEEGKSPWRAAVEGTQEVSAGVISSLLTTIVIFVPIVMCIKGIIGILFRDIAFTFMITLGLSLITAFTFIPCASHFLLKKKISLPGAQITFLPSLLQQFGEKIQNLFLSTLAYFLDRPKKAIYFVVSIYLLCLSSFLLLPGQDLIPLGEFKEFLVKIKGPKGAHLDYLNDQAKKIEQELIQKKEIKTVATSVQENEATIFSNLKQGESSLHKAEHYLGKLREEFSPLPDIETHVLEFQKLDTTEGIGSPLTLVIKHPDEKIRKSIAHTLTETLSKIPDFLYIRTSEEIQKPEIKISVDHHKIRDLNLSADEIAELVYVHMEGVKASQLTKTVEYSIPIRIEDSRHTFSTKQDLETLPILLRTEKELKTLPLDSLASIQENEGESIRERTDHVPSTTLYAQLKTDHRSLEQILADIKTILGSYPPEITDIESTFKVYQDTFSDLYLALLLAIVLVYMILAAQFESLIQPWVLMLSIPLSSIGVVLAVRLWGFYVDVIVMLGIILLVGLVVDSGTLLIEYTNILRHRGMDRREAILTATRRRLRPIFIVALTDVVGVMPMAWSTGSGSEMYRGYGVVTMLGITVSMILNPLMVPLTYALFEDLADYLNLKYLWIKTLWIHLTSPQRRQS